MPLRGKQGFFSLKKFAYVSLYMAKRDIKALWTIPSENKLPVLIKFSVHQSRDLDVDLYFLSSFRSTNSNSEFSWCTLSDTYPGCF